MDVDGDDDADADNSMDWAPLPPSAPSSPFGQQQHVTFARQRFVPPDTRQPTGLEGMFERVVAVREGVEERRDGEVERMQGVEMAKTGSGGVGGGGAWWRGWLGGR